jgi:hypothetical protein
LYRLAKAAVNSSRSSSPERSGISNNSQQRLKAAAAIARWLEAIDSADDIARRHGQTGRVGDSTFIATQ